MKNDFNNKIRRRRVVIMIIMYGKWGSGVLTDITYPCSTIGEMNQENGET